MLQTWQEVSLESEDLKKDLAINSLEVLRQDINLNLFEENFEILESIIHESPQKAGSFLKEISKHYHDNQDQLVSGLAMVQKKLMEEGPKNLKSETKENKGTSKVKSRFLIRSGVRFFLIPVEDVVALYKEDLVRIFTNDGKKYVVDGSLEELNKQLPSNEFFRINRQCIIQAKYLKEMKMAGNNMVISLSIPFEKTLVVSQRSISSFKEWLRDE